MDGVILMQMANVGQRVADVNGSCCCFRIKTERKRTGEDKNHLLFRVCTSVNFYDSCK